MFAIVAAILFGVALLLDILDVAADVAGTLVIAGLLSLAVHLIAPVPWRRP